MDVFYEKAMPWGGEKSPQELLRLRETLALVPEHARSVLEVGCGDGFILNQLAESRKFDRLAGMDGSFSALKHVTPQAMQGSVESLPFADATWDLVMCLEVIEHLPCGVYETALGELQRVARRFIIVTTPNRQNLKNTQFICPQCYCRFHLDRHVRSFTTDTMASLLPDFRLVDCKTCGVEKDFLFRGVAVSIGRRLGVLDSFPPRALCPQCGYQREVSKNGGHAPNSQDAGKSAADSRRQLKSLAKNLIPHRTRGKWIFALFERK